MKVREITCAQLFYGKNTFTIPPFQRRYSWKIDNFLQLWDDLTGVIEGTCKRHFMGTLVLQPNRDSLFSVIDGQQRLATFTIILKVLHEISPNYPKDKTRPFEKYLIQNSRPRLIPSLEDREAFDFLLTNTTVLKAKNHRRVKECFDYFKTEICNYIDTDTKQKAKNFARIYDAVVKHMAFIEIQLDNEDDPHAIFHTINSTGEALTAADLARNFVLSRAGNNDKEQAKLHKTYWQPLESLLTESLSGSKNARNAELQKILPEFIRSALVVERKKYIGSTELFKEIRLHFKLKYDLEDKLKILSLHAIEYCKLLNPAHVTEPDLKIQLERLLELKMTTYNPVLLVLFRAYANKNIKPKTLQLAIQYIESFIIRRAFKGKVSRDLPRVFAVVASKLSSAQSCDDFLPLLVKLLTDAKWPDDTEFKHCFLSQPIYSTAPSTARYALVSIERNGPSPKEINTDKQIQIEHIFPQTPDTNDWRPENIPGLKMRLHVMGNLTLTAYNQKLSNKGFKTKLNGDIKIKLDGYKKSKYWLTKTLLKCNDWTEKEIDQRGEKLFKEALKIWPRPS